jgi:hypothetical protein
VTMPVVEVEVEVEVEAEAEVEVEIVLSPLVYDSLWRFSFAVVVFFYSAVFHGTTWLFPL